MILLFMHQSGNLLTTHPPFKSTSIEKNVIYIIGFSTTIILFSQTFLEDPYYLHRSFKLFEK
jgi:hypothetical protein